LIATLWQWLKPSLGCVYSLNWHRCTIDNYFGILGGNTGGAIIKSPLGVFHDTTTPTAAAINTPYGIKVNTTDLTNGVSVDGTDTSRLIPTTSAVYNIQFSVQMNKSSGSASNAWVWLRVNGVDIPATATKVTVQGSSSALVAAWNFVVPLETSDYAQIMWAVDNTGIQLVAEPATLFCPSIPSVIITMTIVSGLYT
jgi:hypothetical protein